MDEDFLELLSKGLYTPAKFNGLSFGEDVYVCVSLREAEKPERLIVSDAGVEASSTGILYVGAAVVAIPSFLNHELVILKCVAWPTKKEYRSKNRDIVFDSVDMWPDHSIGDDLPKLLYNADNDITDLFPPVFMGGGVLEGMLNRGSIKVARLTEGVFLISPINVMLVGNKRKKKKVEHKHLPVITSASLSRTCPVFTNEAATLLLKNICPLNDEREGDLYMIPNEVSKTLCCLCSYLLCYRELQ